MDPSGNSAGIKLKFLVGYQFSLTKIVCNCTYKFWLIPYSSNMLMISFHGIVLKAFRMSSVIIEHFLCLILLLACLIRAGSLITTRSWLSPYLKPNYLSECALTWDSSFSTISSRSVIRNSYSLLNVSVRHVIRNFLSPGSGISITSACSRY